MLTSRVEPVLWACYVSVPCVGQPETSEETEIAQHPNNLKRAIEASGRKRKWLAGRLGVSRMTLHRWEHGESIVPAERQPEITALLPEYDGDLFPKEEMLDAA